MDKQTNIMLSHYEGRIFRINAEGKTVVLLNLPESRCADFEYIADKNLLVIPTLEESTVIAYKFIN